MDGWCRLAHVGRADGRAKEMNNRAARQINEKERSALVLVQDEATSWLKGCNDAACVVLTDGTLMVQGGGCSKAGKHRAAKSGLLQKGDGWASRRATGANDIYPVVSARLCDGGGFAVCRTASAGWERGVLKRVGGWHRSDDSKSALGRHASCTCGGMGDAGEGKGMRLS